MSRLTVFCRTRFEGFHQWAEAPHEVNFLKVRHRHEFHVELGIWVTEQNRQVEFILLKRELDKVLKRILEQRDTHDWSCERWALEIRDLFSNVAYVVVSEDGENGARWDADMPLE